jgi:hypothetical protein
MEPTLQEELSRVRDAAARGWSWEVMIGLRELLIIGAVVLVLYGRSGLLKGQRAQAIMPWLSPIRRTPARSRGPGGARVGPGTGTTASAVSWSRRIRGTFLLRGNRLFWFLTILAATAVAAIIIGKVLISTGSRAPLLP